MRKEEMENDLTFSNYKSKIGVFFLLYCHLNKNSKDFDLFCKLFGLLK